MNKFVSDSYSTCELAESILQICFFLDSSLTLFVSIESERSQTQNSFHFIFCFCGIQFLMLFFFLFLLLEVGLPATFDFRTMLKPRKMTMGSIILFYYILCDTWRRLKHWWNRYARDYTYAI